MYKDQGSATAPIRYTYDAYNQLEALSTYRTAITVDSAAFPATLGTPDITTWIRDDTTGLLTQKKYADNQGPIYEYDLVGRITRRTMARGTITDYTYTPWGQPDITNYADTTPDIDVNYDRMGRKTQEINGVAASTYQYSITTLRPTLETITDDLDRNGTPELTRQLDRSHDTFRRPTGFTLKDGTTLENQAVYGYDAFSRLGTVSGGGFQPPSPTNTFSYSYIQNSNLHSQVIGPAHTVTNTWELDRDVLDVKENKAGSTVISKYDYTVNAIGQRTALSQTGTAFAAVRGIAWAYDTYGQLTSADSTVSGQDRAYQYDAIGNRTKSAPSLTLPGTDNYTANSLNQYSTLQEGGTGVSPVYDLDGNATACPLPVAPNTNSTLGYDAENRQISSTVGGVSTTYQYDSSSRRISKTTAGTTTLYLYDAWNVIAEYSRSVGVSPTLQKNRLWGPDLSGSMQGVGGVGGLLSESRISDPLSPVYYPLYDGNGNVSEYLNSSGVVNAHFEYDPFGNTTINTDASSQVAYKFSTKPQDAETGLYYYGYRYYDPNTGRWPSRDPIEENGGTNLYGMIGNDAVNLIDILGEGPVKLIPDWHHLVPDDMIPVLREIGIIVKRNTAEWGRIMPDGHYFDAKHIAWFEYVRDFTGTTEEEFRKHIDNGIESEDFRTWYKESVQADVSHWKWRRGTSIAQKLAKAGKVAGIAGAIVGVVISGASAQDMYNKYRRAGHTPAEAATMAGISLALPIDIFEEVYKDYENEPLMQICSMISPSGSKYVVNVVDVLHMMRLMERGWKVCSCD